MTHSEILSMQPGPELDIIVARDVLGCYVRKERNRDTFELVILGGVNYISCVERDAAWKGTPPLSTTWEGMRLVVESMAAKGWELELRYNGKRAIADFHNHGRCRRVKYETAPHAVCIAALLALEGEHAAT